MGRSSAISSRKSSTRRADLYRKTLAISLVDHIERSAAPAVLERVLREFVAVLMPCLGIRLGRCSRSPEENTFKMGRLLLNIRFAGTLWSRMATCSRLAGGLGSRWERERIDKIASRRATGPAERSGGTRTEPATAHCKIGTSPFAAPGAPGVSVPRRSRSTQRRLTMIFANQIRLISKPIAPTGTVSMPNQNMSRIEYSVSPMSRPCTMQG